MQYQPDPRRDPVSGGDDRPAKVIYSPACPACKRFLEAAQRAGVRAELIDVAGIPPVLRSGLRAVPTVMLPDGRNHVGTDAFKWLSQFDSPLDPAGCGALASSLAWSTVAWDAAEGGVTEALAPLTYTGEQTGI